MFKCVLLRHSSDISYTKCDITLIVFPSVISLTTRLLTLTNFINNYSLTCFNKLLILKLQYRDICFCLFNEVTIGFLPSLNCIESTML